ncbi:MAG TPA: alkaline phosphatase PhoX [Acetobacteraceae bacterium]|nr:alkaline phosphatase PhoX [Acetobacteraceae bacterium]
MISRRLLLGGTASLLACGTALAQNAGMPPLPPPPDPEAPQLNDLVAQGFERYVMIRWGDPVLSNSPAFTPGIPNEAAAARQFGWDAIIAGIVNPPPAEDGVLRCVMVVSHPDVWPRMAFPGGVDHPLVAGKMQGASVLNLSYRGGRWVTVDGGYQSRRITDGTLCRMTGPAAAELGTTVQGVLAPQIGCVTPWNTVLFPEGPINGWLNRLEGQAEGYADPAVAPRFGWVTEVDALDPNSFPAKHTALGRFQRAGVACALAQDGSPIVFMTEDAPMGRLFRFKGAAPAGDGGSALASGTLSVARIQGSTIIWQDLPEALTSLTATLSAADQAGGSAFDSPAGMAIAPDQTLYLACSGNPGRGLDQVDALNPRSGNGAGHILRFTPQGADLAAKVFQGEVILLAGNPAADPTVRYAPGSMVWLRAPRSLTLDRQFQLWIGTDQRGAVTDAADGLFVMRTRGYGRFALNGAYMAPIGGAIGGAALGPDGHTLFTVARHPGATVNSSFNAPATRWPTVQPGMPPQTTMVALNRGV